MKFIPLRGFASEVSIYGHKNVVRKTPLALAVPQQLN